MRSLCRMDSTVTSGATPWKGVPGWGAAAMRPATRVPCPLQSVSDGPPGGAELVRPRHDPPAQRGPRAVDATVDHSDGDATAARQRPGALGLQALLQPGRGGGRIRRGHALPGVGTWGWGWGWGGQGRYGGEGCGKQHGGRKGPRSPHLALPSAGGDAATPRVTLPSAFCGEVARTEDPRLLLVPDCRPFDGLGLRDQRRDVACDLGVVRVGQPG